MATNKAELDAKRLYFNQLSALGESSDEEHDAYSIQDVLGTSKAHTPHPFLSAVLSPARIRTPVARQIDKVLDLHQTKPAPIPDETFIEETPLGNQRRFSQYPEQAPLLSKHSSMTENTPEHRPQAGQRTVSNPTLGTDSLVLNHSTGIESMLGKRNRTASVPGNGKKKLRKKPSVELVPESEQVFRENIFYYIPPDNKSQLRRIRIDKARKFGATWTRELIPSTTHIIVDKALTFKDVMTFLKLETLPSNMIMVSEEYPLDSIEARFLLDPMQKQYTVSGDPREVESPSAPPQISDKPSEPGTLKPNQGAEVVTTSKQTLPLSHSMVANEANGNTTRAPSPRPIFVAPDEEHKDLGGNNRDASAMTDARASFQPKDDLERMIQVAQSMEHVPINDEEDDMEDEKPPPRGDQSDGSGSDNESRRPSSRKAAKAKWKGSGKDSFNQQGFTCMTGGTGITGESNPNARTIEVLQKMADYYVETKDHWRQTAYRKTIGVLRKQNTRIASYDEAIRLPTIGHRLAMKIEEIVLTNGLRRLDDAVSDPNYHILHTFMNIYGVGINQAWKWVQQGHTSLEDLRAHVRLSKNQLLGIEHYNDFLIRIPRDEVTALGTIVREAAATIDPEVEAIISGSYRRGALNSGDIDILLTKPTTASCQELLEFLTKLTNDLTSSGFLVAALVTPSQTGSKWHGCCMLPGAAKPIWRRIDLLIVPATELGAALIYFTGDDIFNRSIRLLASKKGWRLNQRGLYKDVLRGPGRIKLTEGSLIEGADEKKIFAAMGVPWRPPEQRICH